MRVVVVTPPEPVITLAEAKAHLRVRHSDEDTLIEAYISAATSHIDGPDGWLGRALGEQVLEAYADVFRDCMRLPFGPVIEMVSVKYIAGPGDEVTLLPTEYELRGWLLGSAFGKRWPSVLSHPEAVRIRYRAGYTDLPPPIRAAILLMVGDIYLNRETVSIGAAASQIPMSTTVANLLSPYRIFA